VANVHNKSLTAPIEVCLPLYFAVVFDFIYFRFRPSKAQSIGNVCINRQSAVLKSIVFFSFILRIAY
jgi:hypothetical protein